MSRVAKRSEWLLAPKRGRQGPQRCFSRVSLSLFVLTIVSLCASEAVAGGFAAPADSVGTAQSVDSAQVVAILARKAPDQARKCRPDPWFGRDKAAHFTVSAFVAAASYYAGRREAHWKDGPSQRLSFGISLSLGVAKELWDKYGRKGTPSWRDLTADLLGTVVGIALVAVPDGTVLQGGR